MITTTNLKVAIGHLQSRVKQVLVATLSVTFGISMYIFLNGFMTGVNDIQNGMAFSTLAHVHIYNDLPEDRSNLLDNRYPEETHQVLLRNSKVIQYTEGMDNAERLVQRVSQLEGVVEVGQQINLGVYFRNGATKVSGTLAGVNAADEDRLFDLSESVTAGEWASLDQQRDGVILGIGLAKKLSVGLDDPVVVTTSDGLVRNFNVIGLLETTVVGVDNSKAYVRISSARQLVSENRSYATDIQIKLDDFSQAEAVADQMKALTNYKVEPWTEANGQLQAGSDLRDYLALAVSLTILLVAGFGIYNIMNMTVNEKIKEIAILKAMGFEGGDIVQIFLTQSLIIGVLGGIVGLLFGYGVSLVVSNIPFNVGNVETLPMSFLTSDYLSAALFGLLTTLIAGYLPAKKASHVDPVAIIRG